MKHINSILVAGLTACGITGCIGVATDASTNTNVKNETTVNMVSMESSKAPAQTIAVFSPKGFVEVMEKDNRDILSGWTPESDVWLIVVEDVPITGEVALKDAADIAEVRAKKRMAAFLGETVSGKEESVYVEKTVNDKVYTESYFESVQKIDVDQFLRGVTLYEQKTVGGNLHSVYYVTGKMVDVTEQLQKQIAAAPPGCVQSVGISLIVNSRLDQAKQKAVSIALKNAVEQVLGTTVVGQSQLMDNDRIKSKVVSQSIGNIKQYRIVKEGQLGVNYQVIMNVEVDEKTIMDNYASIVKSLGNPGFYIQSEDPDLQTAFSEYLADLGLNVVIDADKAQFCFDAECNYIVVQDSHYGDGIQIDLTLRLVDIDSRQQLLTQHNDAKLTSTYSGNYHQIRQSAARKAFKSMSKQLHERLNKVILDWVMNGRTLAVSFSGAGADDPALLKILEDAISDVPCAKVLDKQVNGGTVTFNCSFVGPTSDFEYFLQARLAKDLPAGIPRPKTSQISFNILKFQF